MNQSIAQLIFLLFTILLLTACDSTEQASNQSSQLTDADRALSEQIAAQVQPREAMDRLTQEEAEVRKKRISNVAYRLDIDLISLPDDYQGKVLMNFTLNSSAADLTVDFTGGVVQAIEVNGQSVEVDYNGFFVTLAANNLTEGENQVLIEFQHPYEQDGNGLHRFVDPEDGRTYLYTYLWPYYANRLFPHFDQPNIKATYELTVRAQADWQVVSAVQEERIENDQGAQVWYFPQSQKFSSYIFSLHAGPYRVWEDVAGEVPIRLMARQSLAPYVPVEEWMAYTQMGLAHFKKYFDIAYPFGKYDQLLVPDFNIGAMENVAAVTFNESVIQKGASSRFERQRRADIILHEMAHMWFGNLVTKDWWNGLWLNESFATLMASIAVSELPEFSDFWHDFYLSINLSAIEADNMVSTHPIELPVPSTSDFFSVFDAITYDKGSSVLNQLSHYVGQENFRLGVSEYLKQHAWGNTELDDFIVAQSKQSGLDLQPWSKKWLYQAGVNRVQVNYSCENGKINMLDIQQSAPTEQPTLRSHKTQLALFNQAMQPMAVIPVSIGGPSTSINQAVGQPCPHIIYPNYQAWGYVEVALDEVSQINAIDGISQSRDPMLRSMLWTSVLSDKNVALKQVITALEAEENDRIVDQVQQQLIKKMDQLERQGNPQLAAVFSQFESSLWRLLNAAASDSNLNLIRLKNYLAAVRSAEGQDKLLNLLNEQIELPAVQLSQEHRWAIIQRLAVLNHPQIVALIEREKSNDPSDAGRLGAIAAEASLPDKHIKQSWVNHFKNNEQAMPFSQQRVAMAHLFPANQTGLQDALLADLLAMLPMIRDSKDHYYQRAYAQSLFAGVCNQSSLDQLEAVLDKDQLGTTLYRFLAENIQQAQACVTEVVTQ